MPEEGHFLLQRSLGIHQVIEPIYIPHRRLPAGQQRGRLITKQGVGVDWRLRLGMQQLLDGFFITFCDTRFEFVPSCSEPRPAHQVSHQSYVFLVCHLRGPPPFADLFVSQSSPTRQPRLWRKRAPTRRRAHSPPEAVITTWIVRYREYAIRP